MTNTIEGTQWAVIIEWDGQKPESTYYRRLHKLTGGVRGGNRAQEGRGVIVQESCIICASESLARTLAIFVRDEVQVTRPDVNGQPDTRPTRRPDVYVAPLNFIELEIEERDQMTLKRMHSVLGKRGRPGNTVNHRVTCYECVRSFDVAAARGDVANCPQCGGLHIRAEDEEHKVSERATGGVLDPIARWALAHFTSSNAYWSEAFHVPETYTQEAATYPEDFQLDNWQSKMYRVSHKERAGVEQLAASDELRGVAVYLFNAGRLAEGMEVLNAAFVARAYRTPAQRLQARAEAVTKFFTEGGQPADISLVETPAPDILDTASVLGSGRTVSLLREYIRNSSGQLAERFTAVCKSCAAVMPQNGDKLPDQCPRCDVRGHMHLIEGEAPTFSYDVDASPFENWTRSRFSLGVFVPAQMNHSAEAPPVDAEPKKQADRDVIARMAATSPVVVDYIDELSTAELFDLLDNIFTAFATETPEEATQKRAVSWQYLIQRGYTAHEVPLMHAPGAMFDVVDVATYSNRYTAVRMLKAAARKDSLT